MTYNLFQVSNYKGGELHSDVNLNKKELVEELYSMIYDIVYEFNNVDQLKSYFKTFDLKSDLYASDNGNVFQIFENTNEGLKEIEINQFKDELFIISCENL